MLPPSAMQEVGDVDSQCSSDVEQMRQLHLASALHALDGAAIDASLVSEYLLSHVEVQPAYTDAVADGPTGVEDPLRLIGWHPGNALSTMIISQQQI
ncbi:hypothetical protein [Streptomyces anthocyanicus]